MQQLPPDPFKLRLLQAELKKLRMLLQNEQAKTSTKPLNPSHKDG
jgi:hypothetical protein